MSKPQNEQSKKKQFVVFGLCSLVALVLCMVTLVITARQVEKENISSSEGAVVKQSATEMKSDVTFLSDYAFSLTKKAQNNRFVKINSYTGVSVDDSTVRVVDKQGNEKDNSLLLFSKNRLITAVDGWYGEDYTGVFGTVYDKMPVIDLLDVKTAAARYTIGMADDKGNPVYDDSGVLVDEGFYYLTFNADGKSATEKSIAGTFRISEAPAVGEMLKKELKAVCTVTDSRVEPSGYTAVLKTNRFTDEIVYIELERLYDVKADVAFTGNMSAFGEGSVEFTYKVTEHFDYYYAGVSFTNEPLSLGVGEEGVVSVNAVIEDDSDYTVTFASSDESVATVDEMGYVTALAESDEPVYITVTLKYMGEEFTDECPVYVDNADN